MSAWYCSSEIYQLLACWVQKCSDTTIAHANKKGAIVCHDVFIVAATRRKMNFLFYLGELDV